MPLVRVHKASDGKLFENYSDYLKHEEKIKFDQQWEKKFPNEAEAYKAFVQENSDALLKLIADSKIKRRGGRKK